MRVGGPSGILSSPRGDLVRDQAAALRCWQGEAPLMDRAHRHDDLEVNLVTGAPLTYLFGGTLVEIRPGSAALFWAAVPHRLVEDPGNRRARVRWLHVPLASVLGWGLSAASVSALLGGLPLVAPHTVHPDEATVGRWNRDLATGVPELREITLLEMQAAVRRLLLDAAPPGDVDAPDGRVRQVAAMARYVAEHHREPVTAADVAAAVHLHPNYAMTLFRRVLGTTLHTYLTQRRVAEAQRLLLTSDVPVGQVGGRTGFGSQSSFYEAFSRVCGCPPGEYRRRHAGG